MSGPHGADYDIGNAVDDVAAVLAETTTLEAVLPNAERVELPGLGHNATGNARTGGKPALVAVQLRQFLT
ncbi:hypothetical protein [Flindersiella endophytica]